MLWSVLIQARTLYYPLVMWFFFSVLDVKCIGGQCFTTELHPQPWGRWWDHHGTCSLSFTKTSQGVCHSDIMLLTDYLSIYITLSSYVDKTIWFSLCCWHFRHWVFIVIWSYKPLPKLWGFSGATFYGRMTAWIKTDGTTEDFWQLPPSSPGMVCRGLFFED